jgi:cell division protein FtsB
MPDTVIVWKYARTFILLLALLAGGLMFNRMLVHMETMAVLMASMSESMASMSTDISAMRASMEQLDRTVGKGAREMQQLNPMQMMVPGGH